MQGVRSLDKPQSIISDHDISLIIVSGCRQPPIMYPNSIYIIELSIRSPGKDYYIYFSYKVCYMQVYSSLIKNPLAKCIMNAESYNSYIYLTLKVGKFLTCCF